jgi:hypothetical protein
LGHSANNYWFKEGKKDKRPVGFRDKFKNTGEKVNIVKDLNRVNEFFLSMTDGKIIDGNIWKMDSAATVHMISDSTGSVKKKSPPRTYTVTLGTGQEEVVKIVDILLEISFMIYRFSLV